MSKSDFGLIGLAVMGQNLVLNVESRGFQVSVYNRTTSVTDEFVASQPDKKLVGSKSLEEFVQSMASPRKIMIMVKAGGPVDAVIESLIPLLDKGECLPVNILVNRYSFPLRLESRAPQSMQHTVRLGG